MRAQDFLSTQSLFEINMSPTSLKASASKVNATVGIEFEMVVPDVEKMSEADEVPDYEESVDCENIEQICDFFETNRANNSEQIAKLKHKLTERFKSWLMDQDPEDEMGNNLSSQFLWLSNHDLDTTYAVYRKYNDIIDWPFMTYPEEGSEGEISEDSLAEIASEFGHVVETEVDYSTTYHGGDRSPYNYTVEPDTSIEVDDKDTEGGLEFISPPLSLDEMVRDLSRVVRWAKNKGCYTNSSTGLHINVSIPGFSKEKLDYVKLALLLGDEYVLKQFGRLSNTYTQSAFQKVTRFNSAQDIELLFKQLKSNLGSIASKVIHDGQVGKYTSINPKTGYIEFRSVGGDWLNEDLGKLENTIYRFVVALDSACNPEKDKQEYYKKLFKVFSPKKDTTIEKFVQYAAGKISKENLKASIRSMQDTRALDKFNQAGRSGSKSTGVIPFEYYSQGQPGDFWLVYDDGMTNNSIGFKRTDKVHDHATALAAALRLNPNFIVGGARNMHDLEIRDL